MNDSSLVNFLVSMSDAIKKITGLKKDVELMSRIATVEIDYSIYGSSTLEKPGISIGLSAKLIKPLQDNFHALGLSFSIFYIEDGLWRFTGEVGWSSYDYGFDELYSINEKDTDSFLLSKELDTMVDDLITNYKNIVNDFNLNV